MPAIQGTIMPYEPSNDWQPTADIATLKQRANIIADIRQFFAQRNVMEVETPSLSAASVTAVSYTHLTLPTNREV